MTLEVGKFGLGVKGERKKGGRVSKGAGTIRIIGGNIETEDG